MWEDVSVILCKVYVGVEDFFVEDVVDESAVPEVFEGEVLGDGG